MWRVKDPQPRSLPLGRNVRFDASSLFEQPNEAWCVGLRFLSHPQCYKHENTTVGIRLAFSPFSLHVTEDSAFTSALIPTTG